MCTVVNMFWGACGVQLLPVPSESSLQPVIKLLVVKLDTCDCLFLSRVSSVGCFNGCTLRLCRTHALYGVDGTVLYLHLTGVCPSHHQNT